MTATTHKQPINFLSSPTFFLIVLAVVAFFLRFYLLPQHLFFGPEQGIDFMVIRDIATGHKLTLIGAKTDIPGIFHGPIYYYIAAIPFFLSYGNPLSVSFLLVMIQSLSIFLIYGLGKEMWDQRVGLIAAMLLTVSYAAVVYSRWLSAQPIAIPFVCLFFYAFVRFLKGSKSYLLLAAFSFGLLVQSQFLNLLLFSAILMVLVAIFYRHFIKTPLSLLISSVAILGVTSLGNFLLFDIKHQFLMSKAIGDLLAGKRGFYLAPQIIFQTIWQQAVDFYSATLTLARPQLTIAFFVIITLLLLVKLRHPLKNMSQTVLFVWLFVPFALFFILHHEVILHYFIPFLPAYILAIAYALELLIRQNKHLGWISVCALVIFNLFAYRQNIPQNMNIFFQANQLTFFYQDEQKVIADIYHQAGNKVFSFQAFTIPYWVQDGWEYLFWYEGTTIYHRFPTKDNPDLLF
ncbi:MAG TPA: glycosyltransferase family 39 protein, partial [Patescibacteria group bacterium]|nr:glycosyltransferase family 39 protein [Patescibacteria group bacterium]